MLHGWRSIILAQFHLKSRHVNYLMFSVMYNNTLEPVRQGSLSYSRGVFRGGAQGARAPPSVGHAQNQVQPKL